MFFFGEVGVKREFLSLALSSQTNNSVTLHRDFLVDKTLVASVSALFRVHVCLVFLNLALDIVNLGVKLFRFFVDLLDLLF